MAKDYVIVGASVAGTAAAAAIREQDRDGRILLLGEEEFGLYSRIRLPEYLAGRLERERLVIRKGDWYAGLSIDLRTGTRVESVDLAGGRVSLSGGETIGYDRLLLATGARCFVPPFAGRDLPGVLTVRTVKDVDRLRAREAVVIGGGLLGLEMASALARLGLTVGVVELLPWLLPRQLDRQGGELLQRILERSGLRFHLGARVDAIAGDDQVRAVRLESGEEIPAEVVLVSAGIEPRVELARAAGIRAEKGMVIGDRAETSAEGVFAAGDCAEHRGRIYGIWPAAEAQGRVAGMVMAGGDAVYKGTLPAHTLKVSGVNVFSAGEFDVKDESRCKREAGAETYRKEVFDDGGRTVGAILIGDLGDRRKILAAINDGSRL
jgi:nitrite reductase (NADH) large subunit